MSPAMRIAASLGRSFHNNQQRFVSFLALAVAAMIAWPAAAQPWPANMCSADRAGSHLNCTANDVQIAAITVNSGPSSCLAGETVTLDLSVGVLLNAQNRHDIGLFLAKDGKSVIPPSSAGGSANCGVFGVPMSPPPWADLDGNACGDFDRGAAPAGTAVSVNIGTLTLACTAGPTGKLVIPSMVTWQENATPTSCQAPASQWVHTTQPSKCEVATALEIPVTVMGRIDITKQTLPDASAGTFTFNATGTGISPASIQLADNGTDHFTIASLGSTKQTYTITEELLSGFESTASILCTDTPTGTTPSAFATVNTTTRTISVDMSSNPTQGVTQIYCTVTNSRQLSTLNIYKQAVPHGTQAFNFGTTGGLSPSTFTLADDGTNPNVQTYTGLVPGSSYTVSEVVPGGWVLTALTCSDIGNSDPAQRSTVDLATKTVTPHLAAGETLDCTFTNTQIQLGAITVTKTSVGGDSTFAFTNSGGSSGSTTNPDAFSITTGGAAHNGSHELTLLSAGTYVIAETVPSGWDLQPVSCTVTNGTNTTITPLANGTGVTIVLGNTGGVNVDSVSCQFTDVKRGTITIAKTAAPKDPQLFTFNATSNPATTPLPGSFTLKDDGASSNSQSWTVVPGSYVVTEAVPADWKLLNLVCSGGSNVTADVPTGVATIGLQAGENVTCTFANGKNGTISITKVAVGGTGTEQFQFTGALSGSIANGQSLSGTFGAGTRSISETVPAGWTLSSIACSGAAVSIEGAASGGSGFDLGDNTVNITLTEGQAAACTFTNTKDGSIDVVKHTVGGDGTFSFTGAKSFDVTTSGGTGHNATAFGSVPPGTYAITEVVPSAWALSTIACSNGSATDVGTATASVVVGAGEHVTCTFTDTSKASIIITKRSYGETQVTANFLAPQSLAPTGTFSLTPNPVTGLASRTFSNLAAGVYTVAEAALPEGWVSASITCNDPTGNSTVNLADRAATIDLAAGETVECVFENTSLGTVIVGVVSTGGVDMFPFAAPSLGANLFTLTTLHDNQEISRVFTGLQPGTYEVQGLGGPEWVFVSLSCRNNVGEHSTWTISGPHASVTLPHGEVVECVYVYRLAGAPPQAGPTGEDIPTLSEWAMILMATLMVVFGGAALRRAGIR